MSRDSKMQAAGAMKQGFITLRQAKKPETIDKIMM
jgi:hypothetical protein